MGDFLDFDLEELSAAFAGMDRRYDSSKHRIELGETHAIFGYSNPNHSILTSLIASRLSRRVQPSAKPG